MMKTAGYYALLFALVITVYGGIPYALSASVPPRAFTPVSPSDALNPPQLDIPAGGKVRDAPVGSKPKLRSKPLPVPAPTDHYAGSAGIPSSTVR